METTATSLLTEPHAKKISSLFQVGGKNFHKSMNHVNNFVTELVDRSDKIGFNRAAAFFDENFEATDK